MTAAARQSRHTARLKQSGGMRLTVRLTGREVAALEAVASARGLSLSAAVVALIRECSPTAPQ